MALRLFFIKFSYLENLFLLLVNEKKKINSKFDYLEIEF